MSPERASVFETLQIGLEGTPGTGVAANKQILSMSIDPTADVSVDLFRPMGNKFVTVAASGKDLVSATVRGKPTYTEILYPLASMLGGVSPTGPDAQGAYTWAFVPASTAADNFQTYTVERGSSLRAAKWAYGLFNGIGLTASRETVDMNGTMIGRALQDGITMTSTPTALALVPVLGKEFSVWCDPSSAALGTTKLGRVLRLDFNLQNKYAALWALDQAQSSFVSTVERAPDVTGKILVEADAAGMALLADVRAGNTKFLRLLATGPVIGTTAGTPPVSTNYSLGFDFAAKLSKPDQFSDSDGVYAIGFNFQIAHDATWGKALTATVVNGIASL